VAREDAFRAVAVGDIFHGEGGNGASLICLATAVTKDTIHARTITSQYELEFDRGTGVCEWGTSTGIIDSVAQLPNEIRRDLLSLDRRYRAGDNATLSDAEKRALIFVASFYPANPV
jgi:hypothetical protein